MSKATSLQIKNNNLPSNIFKNAPIKTNFSVITCKTTQEMPLVRCNCGTILFAPLGMQNARCPTCSSLFNFISKLKKPQHQVPAVVQNYNFSSTKPNHGNYLEKPSQILPFPSNRKKRAVLIGVSYLGQKNSVKGSVNDVKMMTNFLIQKSGFASEYVLILTEEDRDLNRIPTRRNIQTAMSWLIQGCRAGDSLVFFYSGHGSQEPDKDGDEVDGFDETLCPVDYRTQGKILDDEINEAIVRPLPLGAKLHAIIDTCRSGTLLDLSFMCKMNQQGNYRWEDHRISTAYKGTSGGIAICFSACDDHENSLDTTNFPTGTITGAMTSSFIQSVENGGVTYGGLLRSIRAHIRKTENRLFGPNVLPPTPQVPQLTSSEKFDIHTKKFML